ncbi:hypothetical protein TNCV_2695561 [Trichonephila clavipes]|nr:hypothetical protein TNCV_2695561 [Trichonephila clavipes]
MCDAEAVINSRPLNYLSEDPDDLTPLTPSMFFQDIQTVGVPDLDNIDNINLTKRLREQQSWFENNESSRCGAHWLRQQEETRSAYGTDNGGVSRKGQFS